MKTLNKKTRTSLRLFPYLKDKELGEKLLIDDDSIHYISVREYAQKISEIIKTHIKILNSDDILENKIIITDMTAGVGGDTISFSKNFSFVYSIELDTKRAQYLDNNINIYECDNVKIFNNNSMDIINSIPDHNIIYIDPPWGGVNYKLHQNLRVQLDNQYIEDVCDKLMDITFMNKVPELIVLKLPKNYDIVYFYKRFMNHKIYYYDLKKMIIIVIYVSQ